MCGGRFHNNLLGSLVAWEIFHNIVRIRKMAFMYVCVSCYVLGNTFVFHLKATRTLNVFSWIGCIFYGMCNNTHACKCTYVGKMGTNTALEYFYSDLFNNYMWPLLSFVWTIAIPWESIKPGIEQNRMESIGTYAS